MKKALEIYAAVFIVYHLSLSVIVFCLFVVVGFMTATLYNVLSGELGIGMGGSGGFPSYIMFSFPSLKTLLRITYVRINVPRHTWLQLASPVLGGLLSHAFLHTIYILSTKIH